MQKPGQMPNIQKIAHTGSRKTDVSGESKMFGNPRTKLTFSRVLITKHVSLLSDMNKTEISRPTAQNSKCSTLKLVGYFCFSVRTVN